jgi:hypothetical protein
VSASVQVPVAQRLPNLLIVGVKKAGTTSLVDYLGQHPDICPGDVKAVNYFRGGTTGSPASAPRTLDEYAAHWAHAAGEPYRIESPTTYFYRGRAMAEEVAHTLPGARVVVSLRDPVTRLWSDYHMKRREDPARLGEVDFAEYVRRGEAAHRSGDLEAHPGYAAFARGMYAEVAAPWFDVFGDRFRIVFVEQWSRDPAGLVRDLCHWLGIPAGPVAGIDFPVRNPQRDFRSRHLARAARTTYKQVVARLPGAAGVKPALVRAHDRLNGRPDGTVEMAADVRAHLRQAYAPSNAALAEMLRGHGVTSLPGWLRDA